MAEPDAKFLLREALQQFAASDEGLGTMEDALPALTAFLNEFAAPGFVCSMAGLPPTPPVTYPGVEGVARGWSDFSEAFEDLRADLEEIRESDDHLVVLVDQKAVTRTGGVEMSQPSAMVFAFDDKGQVARVEFHLDRDAALRTAGLGPA